MVACSLGRDGRSSPEARRSLPRAKMPQSHDCNAAEAHRSPGRSSAASSRSTSRPSAGRLEYLVERRPSVSSSRCGASSALIDLPPHTRNIGVSSSHQTGRLFVEGLLTRWSPVLLRAARLTSRPQRRVALQATTEALAQIRALRSLRPAGAAPGRHVECSSSAPGNVTV